MDGAPSQESDQRSTYGENQLPQSNLSTPVREDRGPGEDREENLEANVLEHAGKGIEFLARPECEELVSMHSLFLFWNDKFFHGALSSCEVRWSSKMTLCAGLCVYQKTAGYCSIRLSSPLLQFRTVKEFKETLLHEMIHAYLFVTRNNKDHDSHGPEFQKHMNRINVATGFNITVFHTFHDEVDYYRRHIWRCSGVCRTRPPYYGYVKRATNRAPHPRDPWWGKHESSCQGHFQKISDNTPVNVNKSRERGNKKRNIGSSQNMLEKYFNKRIKADPGIAPTPLEIIDVDADAVAPKASLSPQGSDPSSSSSHTAISRYPRKYQNCPICGCNTDNLSRHIQCCVRDKGRLRTNSP